LGSRTICEGAETVEAIVSIIAGVVGFSDPCRGYPKLGGHGNAIPERIDGVLLF
jgi:hypothetical protein